MERRLTKEEWEREQQREQGNKLLLGELVAMSRVMKMATITAAAQYRSGNDSCGSVYMGGLATAALVRALGGRYGQDAIDPLLMTATDAQLNAGLEQCLPYITHMRKHPTTRCPCCGGIVSAETGKAS